MTLFEVISRLGEYSDDDMIFAAQTNGSWLPGSYAFVVPMAEDGRTTEIIEGIESKYFLEIDLAKEILEAWLDIAGKLSLSNEEKFKVALHYAERDTWPDPIAVEERLH